MFLNGKLLVAKAGGTYMSDGERTYFLSQLPEELRPAAKIELYVSKMTGILAQMKIGEKHLGHYTIDQFAIDRATVLSIIDRLRKVAAPDVEYMIGYTRGVKGKTQCGDCVPCGLGGCELKWANLPECTCSDCKYTTAFYFQRPATGSPINPLEEWRSLTDPNVKSPSERVSAAIATSPHVKLFNMHVGTKYYLGILHELILQWAACSDLNKAVSALGEKLAASIKARTNCKLQHAHVEVGYGLIANQAEYAVYQSDLLLSRKNCHYVQYFVDYVVDKMIDGINENVSVTLIERALQNNAVAFSIAGRCMLIDERKLEI